MPKPIEWPDNKEWKGRKPGPYQWYEIQDNIAYWKEFEEPKILYQEIATFQSFAWDDRGSYSNNKTFLVPGGSLYLLALLNSSVTWFFLGQIVSKLQGGAYAMHFFSIFNYKLFAKSIDKVFGSATYFYSQR